MNLLQINNLSHLVELEYAHICLHPGDLLQFTNIPAQAKLWYPFKGRGQLWEKRGFFNSGKTTVWYHHSMKTGHIKIIDRIPKDVPQWVYDAGDACRHWSDQFSFEEANSVSIIQRMMKLKAFW